MNRTLFFDHIRQSLYGGTMSPEQVRGTEAILDACARYDVTNLDHVANVLANVRRETGGYMLGIKETVMPWHKDKNPSDATVIARLDKAWAAGKLKGVKAPYWRNGEFGRGPIQVTHLANRKKFAKRLGLPIDKDASLLLDPVIGAATAVLGMKEGIFRGKKLADYKFPSALNNSPDSHPRRIVNGKDGSDTEVSASHRAYVDALLFAGYGKPAEKRDVRQEPPPDELAHYDDAPPQPVDPEPVATPASVDPLPPFLRSVTNVLTGLGVSVAGVLSADWKVVAVIGGLIVAGVSGWAAWKWWTRKGGR